MILICSRKRRKKPEMLTNFSISKERKKEQERKEERKRREDAGKEGDC